MADRVSGLEKAISCKSLICLLQALTGQSTTVELRSEAWARGTVVNVDAYMNITLSGVIFCDPAGRQIRFSSFFIHGRQVRYVQIPDQISPIDAIRRQLDSERGKRKEEAERLRSRRAQKARAYHQDTVRGMKQQ